MFQISQRQVITKENETIIIDKDITEENQQLIIDQDVEKSVKKLYRVIKRHTGKVGGYGHNCSIYGEITIGSFQRIVNFLKDKLEFSHNSIFLDIGAGLGKPNFHVLLDPRVRYSFGVELESLRYALSIHNLSKMHEVSELSFLRQKPNIYFSHNDVTEIKSFYPCTHIYTFDVGMPPETMIGMAKAMQNSSSVKSFVSFHKPRQIINDYEFPVELVGTINTTMHGSSEGHKAYVFRHRNYNNVNLLPSPVFDKDKLLQEFDGNLEKVEDKLLQEFDGNVEKVERILKKDTLQNCNGRARRCRRIFKSNNNTQSDHTKVILLQEFDGNVEKAKRILKKDILQNCDGKGRARRCRGILRLSSNTRFDYTKSSLKKRKRGNFKIWNETNLKPRLVDPVLKKGFEILKQCTKSDTSGRYHEDCEDKYSKWIKKELDVYFPKERPKRVCTLKSLR